MKLSKGTLVAILFSFALIATNPPVAAQDQPVTEGAKVSNPAQATSPQQAMIAREVRHELLTMPYYGVFDWIEFEVQPDGTVILRGDVTAPPDKKGRAEAAAKRVEGVTRVVNNIELLPVSPSDDRLRLALHRTIYGFDSPLHRYGVGVLNSIHIIVRNGRATLRGVVDSAGDRQIAYTRARGVPGLFEVTNELRVTTETPR